MTMKNRSKGKLMDRMAEKVLGGYQFDRILTTKDMMADLNFRGEQSHRSSGDKGDSKF